MNEILCRQLAADYCCSPADVLDGSNHFVRHQFWEGRRRFQEGKACFLKLAVVNGKILFAGKEEIIAWCEASFKDSGGAWFLEPKNLCRMNEKLLEFGYVIETAHPFFIADTVTEVNRNGREIRWFERDEIEQFRGDGRFDEAFAFCGDAPDVIGVAAVDGDHIYGMAGASCDSPTMWQIGINVDAGKRGSGTAKMLVALLKNEILSRGILPYYGTSMSHIASQRVALGAGFLPAWVELVTSEAK